MSKDNDDGSTAIAAIDVTGPKCSGIFGVKKVSMILDNDRKGTNVLPATKIPRYSIELQSVLCQII